MKSHVAYVNSGPQRNGKGLNTSIQVLVIQSIFIVPDSRSGIGHLVTDEPNAIVAWIRLDLIYRRASPSSDGWLLSHGSTYGAKRERLVDSGYGVALVRSVVVHVALARMTLAPGVFVWDDVFRFRKIRRSRV